MRAEPADPPVPIEPAPSRARLRAALVVPDALSVSRIALAAGIWLIDRSPTRLLVSAAVAAVTDMLDGFLARTLRARAGIPLAAGGRGDWLDPLCDKIFVLSWLAATWLLLRPPPALLLLLLVREALLLVAYLVHGLAMRGRPIPYRASLPGKATTVLQFTSLTSMLLGQHAVAWASASLAAATGALAAAGYIARSLKAARVTGPRGTRRLAPSTSPAGRG